MKNTKSETTRFVCYNNTKGSYLLLKYTQFFPAVGVYWSKLKDLTFWVLLCLFITHVGGACSTNQ